MDQAPSHRPENASAKPPSASRRARQRFGWPALAAALVVGLLLGLVLGELRLLHGTGIRHWLATQLPGLWQGRFQGSTAHRAQGNPHTPPARPLERFDVQNGTVVDVPSGDELTIVARGSEYDIQLAGIDAPGPESPGFPEARAALAEKVAGRVVTVQIVDVDGGGRPAGTVWYEGRDINREMLQQSHARPDPEFPMGPQPPEAPAGTDERAAPPPEFKND